MIRLVSTALACVALLVAPGGATSQPRPAWLEGFGIRAVDPPTPATDFELPTVDGAMLSLSDFAGDWVVLTFWATWCGPCRSEMPSLERLHDERKDLGVKVLGISVDSSLDPVRPFLDQMGLTFPVLWDERGQVAASYRASSIPLTYLIDPEGRVVGLSRGARDWAELIPMMDGLLELEPQGTPALASAGPLELPSVENPPTARVELVEDAPKVGETFHLAIRLSWAGDFEQYLPQPPIVHLPEGIARQTVTASTDSREGRSVVSYRIGLLASQPGTYALDPIELRYLSRFEGEELSSRVDGPTVEIGPATIAGLVPGTLAAVLGGGLVAGLGILLLVRRRLAAGAGSLEEGETLLYEKLRSRLERSRADRLAGRQSACFLALMEIETALTAEGESESTRERRRMAVEEARYGGKVPAVEELERTDRRLERELEQIRPDPEGELRRELDLDGTAHLEGVKTP